MLECQTLKTEYANLQKLQTEFELELANAIKSGKTEKVQTLKKVITEKLQNLKEKLYPKAIAASYLNSKTNKTKEIKFNIPEVIEKQKAFYQAHNLENFNEQEVEKIFQQHKAEIQREMETYGYDTITIIPANLPTTETLNQKMTEGYENETYQGVKFEHITTIENQKTRIILTHSDQDIYKNPKANPFLKATLNKSIDQLSAKNTEGLSLNEYLLIQRQYFKNTQKHLDGNGWTWLPKSRSAYRIVSSYWNPSSGQLGVRAYDRGYFDVYLGCRLSRSFELT
jgi:hypothetical protein